MFKLETLMVYSIENFLYESEVKSILNTINSMVSKEENTFYEAGINGKSVHSIEGYDVKEVVEFFEPNGRKEIIDLPETVITRLDNAFERNKESIKRAYPTADCPDCWIYLEYEEDQYITPHVDYPHNESRPENIKITGINILLDSQAEGGEFYIETCGTNDIWENNELKPSINYSSNDFKRNIKRTRWVAQQEIGTALFYGTNLIHGTNPNKKGKVRKIVGFITSE